MRAQSEACGTEIVSQTVAKVDLKSRPFKYWLHPMGDDEEIEEEEHTADSIIIATGAKARRLDLPGEEKYWGYGVSACAVCDGSLPMFREQPLVVIGGGDSAVEEALYLTKKAKKVTVLVRRDKLRASRTNARRLTTHPKVEVMFNSGAVEIKGEDKKGGLMSHLVVRNNVTKEEQTIEAKGLFYAVGHDPATALFKGQLDMDEDGYLITKPGEGHTSIEGVFAAGDVQDKKYRQAITSAGKFTSQSTQFQSGTQANIHDRLRLRCRPRGREVPRGDRRQRGQRARDREPGREEPDQRRRARVPLQPSLVETAHRKTLFYSIL
jgi:thioredoxin reductase (NADPH)